MTTKSRIAFKYPGGDVAFCTILALAVGAFILFLGIPATHMQWNFIAWCTLVPPAIGVWFQIRVAGYLFSAIALFLGAISLQEMLFAGDFSILPISRIVGPFYLAFVVFFWAQKRSEPGVA